MKLLRFYIFSLSCIAIIALGFHLSSKAQAADPPVGYWKFNEITFGGTNTIIDSSGTGNHGTPHGPDGAQNFPRPSDNVPSQIYGITKSLNFDGTDDYVSLANPFSGTDFTVSVWVNPAVLNTGEFQGIMGWEGEGPGNRLPSLWVATENNGLHYDSLNAQGGTHYSGIINNFFSQTNKWVHIAWVKDGDSYDIYRNGSLFLGNQPAPETFYSPDVEYYFGKADEKYFSGNLDEIRVFDSALTADEVAELAGLDPAFPLHEEFSGSQPPEWKLVANAAWNASHGSDATLRLTTTETSQSGLGFYDRAFKSDSGIVVEFDYYAHEGTGADGISFFLVDGDQVNAETIQPGAFGGALGYTQSSAPANGIPHAYLGVGFDEFGNFATPNDGKNGGTGSAVPDSVVLRGHGNGTTGYAYLTHTDVFATLGQRIDGGWRTARITVTPADTGAKIRIEMSWDDGATWHTIIDDYQYNQAPPENLKLGFAGSTGGSTNVHAIGTLDVTVPVELQTTLVTPPDGTYARGDEVSYTFQVTNHGPNPADQVSIQNAIPLGSEGFENVVWSYTTSNEATGQGTGVDIGEISSPLAVDETIVVTVTGTIGSEVVAETDLTHAISAHPEEDKTNPAPGGALITVEVDTDVPTQAESDALAKIQEYAETDGESDEPTLNDYEVIGVTDVTEDTLGILNQLVANMEVAEVSSLAEIQPLVQKADVFHKIFEFSQTLGTSEAPTVPDFELVGIEGVTEENIDEVNSMLALGNIDESNILESIQMQVEETLQQLEPEVEENTNSSTATSKRSKSKSKAPTCTLWTPVGTPDLFQIDRTDSTAVLHFTPVRDHTKNYHIVYGFKEGQEQFGQLSARVTTDENSGVQSVAIHDLDPKVSYWFKVAPINGCAVGSWSNWLEAKALNSKSSIFYRYLPNLVK